ncbi:hypothetical protein M3I54_09280 [Paraburkholderia sp. CNPSo 3274]|uniref:hypothetical protein n=1 Tax=Paraburkholderia sp. CNPSo 3274 TaxID=2940932 RepID=UPI0020B66F70|nr:hypothetical protein [Paraburkholderia sp. CNPSo 3274]MCP3707172.1 hypothetical protein [Paraburkholderia sp. CNPSo 3274]
MNLCAKIFGFALAFLLIVVCVYQIFTGPATIVQPIQVSDALKKSGFTEQALQNMLVDALSELHKTAKGVTPRSSSTDADEVVLTEFNLPEFSMPGTGLSMRSVVEYARGLLELDASVYGRVTGSSSGFSVDLTLRDANGESISVHQTMVNTELPAHKPGEKLVKGSSATVVMEETLQRAAMKLLEHQSALQYADNLLNDQQEKCFSNSTNCDFHEVQTRYDQIAAGGGKEPYKPIGIKEWAMRILFKLHFIKNDQRVERAHDHAALAELLLSKIDDLTEHYTSAIAHTRFIRDQSQSDASWQKVLPWAYYNWGVALNDLGCYEAAAEVLAEAINQNPRYAPAFNALARSYNALAETSARATSASTSLLDYRKLARDAARSAVKLDPDYQEAYVNLGDASRPLLVTPGNRTANAAYDGDANDALDAYEKAIALNEESAGRARQQLALIPGAASTHMVEPATKKRPQCRKGMPRSFLEAFGCSEAEMRATASRKGGFINTALTGAPPEAGMCNRLGLQPHERSSPSPLKITATALDVESASHRSAHRQRERG